MNNYDDIINLSRPVSKNHPRMSLENRSGQFAPFSALTGYEEKVKETARLTAEKIHLDEALKNIIDDKIQILKNHPQAKVSITYFVPDSKKSGGSYQTITNTIKKIDSINKQIILKENQKIDIANIINITCDIFQDLL